MNLPKNTRRAVYRDPGIAKYQGNPFIEALTPIMSTSQIRGGLTGNIDFDPKEVFLDGNKRMHLIAQLLDDFFQPISNHLQLESKLSIMIRQGYVGRNPDDGSLNTHMQNGYERVQSGDLEVFRFEHAKSTARSLSLIGCSGCGKSSTLTRMLATYPQVVYHEKLNFTQIVYLKLDCPHDGSLKSLCHHFFRAIDCLLQTNYEQKYALKRHSVETLLALMSQIANVHAIGVLIIDEIQHLSRSNSGGTEKMLNFFVTLVNVIGLPVIMVGTPKARPIFELNLRSARRSAGFGALFWEPMKAHIPKVNPETGGLLKTEWIAFTDRLWKYQWLMKKDSTLSDEVRNCWYDLSQGVLDIVVKLFVLAQVRAIFTRTERITVNLLRQVYKDEFKPVHPMLAALRSNDAELIQKYSDLCMPNIDQKMIELSTKVDAVFDQKNKQIIPYTANEHAQRLHNLLIDMECQSELIQPLIERVFKLYPDLTIRELMPIVLGWYEGLGKDKEIPQEKTKLIKKKDWCTLDSDDLRFEHSQTDNNDTLYAVLKCKNGIFDVENWLMKA
ncbi:AAA family ATPase [Pseudoalteromonas denitrificans]|uniref:Tn7 transposition regulator TnsC n=1 Tax=Pseudoalteromonas denitrificans DSM 6059 TaxID=1123010 RepID=A0A1I1JHA4_9GAMM|nr:AAA family ATPase [Pseudoalteromonas denitrificans]SFC47735.1 Tn7 transposition regulator TnsC [Pseudoalteromonas denitrificans DSM 6059]